MGTTKFAAVIFGETRDEGLRAKSCRVSDRVSLSPLGFLPRDSETVKKLKLLLLGIDGASHAVMQRMLAEGRLPNFAALKRRSSWGSLQSTFPPHTAPGWASMFTGVSPGEHGIYQFWSTKSPDYAARGMNAGDYAREPCWLALQRHGLKVGAFNIPMTHPPVDLEGGYMISWPLSKTLRYTAPASLMSELAAAGLHFHSDLVTMYRGQEDYCEQAARFIRGRAETCLYLQRTRPVDALIVVFTEVDRVSHYFWGSEERPSELVEQCYQQIDEAFGVVSETIDDDTLVIVASDHGFGVCDADFNVHALLESKGLLATHYLPAPRSGPAVQDDTSHTSWFTSPNAYVRTVDWSRTLFYMPTPGCFGLNANLKGREVGGVLEQEDLAAAEAKLAEVIATVTDEAGEALFRLAKSDSVYEGIRLSSAPDYIVIPRDFSIMVAPTLTNELWSKPSQGGVHRPDGVLMVRGSTFPHDQRIHARIEDVHAVILAHLGLPVPDGLEGHWLIDPLEIPPREESNEYRAGPKLTPAESVFMDARLRDIGYM